MNISYEQIKTFVAVVELGSFSAAAKQLKKHRTTLGQAISNLEVEVNMELFDRTSRYPKPTENGHILYQQAKNLAETTKSFEQLCADRARGIEGQVTIYLSELVPRELISDVIQDVRKTYPRVKVNWLHRSHHEAKQAFEEGTADLALMLVPTGNAISSFEYTYLANLPFVFCATPAFNEQNQLKDLLSLKQTRQLQMEDYHYAGIANTLTISNFAQRIESLSVIRQLLLSSDGWAVIPEHCVKDLIDSSQLQTLKLNVIHTKVLFPLSLWSRKITPGPVTRDIIKLFKAHSSNYSL
ncbi:LysR family transcriptional regulator [Vibrio crassostreae]|uniref:LysR family transcriptional regulator n=1 Tax=Vibrio crassostreae TaxID=246167 RepID=UPI0010501F60|nr:LysR family transcriptional regulator [Vibrio crassostreae]TCN91549.1 DNA-binding transcriptional LysR family regulator [Vibrio crassostreae]CAK2017299.1 DNA-binding transcriptional LysR family regulator [Vibrio crassostreae]CAK2023207.1 DNA-binding transcriptional LysR family regulator [Vibrio crassostreae]CAK2058530.1 DNA-binding transcriptional LysR family regulator [Vibrio crassostreae]CAK2065759.1 DNA-binding transcriptional LysR family regulator [Vibrio crassostreae]